MMAGKLLNLSQITLDNGKLALLNCIRHGHTLRGKRPGIAKTLEQRLSEENVVDPEIAHKIDIGFPQLRPKRSDQLKERLTHLKLQRSDPKYEKEARSLTLKIDLDKVKSDWLSTNGQYQIRDIAQHYGIFEHLFGDAYFVPRIPLDIKYKLSDDTLLPIYYGNAIKPSHAKHVPEVSFNAHYNLAGDNSDKKSLWTLIMTNPDGNLKHNDKELVHWFISNIPNGDVSKGDLIVPYLQPFPAKGVGYQRNVFILYKQNKKLDFSNHTVKEIADLEGRTFSTLDFYRKHQDDITPAGLSFFQCDWEKSLTDFYHNVLNMKEPIFEYDFPKAYIKDQTYFPLRQPFNVYMDKYRDPKQVSKEFIERKLAKTHPFDGPEPPLRFPNAHSIKNVPSWLRTEMKRSRLGWGRINDY